MTNTFTITGTTTHSATITGLFAGYLYAYYIRCQDNYNNSDTSDYKISFSIPVVKTVLVGGGTIIPAVKNTTAEESVIAATTTSESDSASKNSNNEKNNSPVSSPNKLTTNQILSLISQIQQKINYLISQLNQISTQKVIFSRDADFGTTGWYVKMLQLRLQNLGFFPKNQRTTGYFGQITKNSLILFQKSNNISQTGVFDSSTRRVMNGE